MALNGGLFGSADKAASDTQMEAEKEQLLAAMVAAVGTNGKVEFGKVVLPKGFTGSAGVYKSTKSGITYTVNPETLYIDDGSEEVKIPEEDITGEYRTNTGGEMFAIRLNADGTGSAFYDSENEETGQYEESHVATLSYTCNKDTKTISLSSPDAESVITGGSLEYEIILDENNNIVNYLLYGTFEGKYFSGEIYYYSKNYSVGLTPLTGYTYENGTKTIEFGTTVKNEKTYGIYTKKTNGILDDDKTPYGCYIGYNGKCHGETTIGGDFTYAEDFSTITLSDGTVYTLKQ